MTTAYIAIVGTFLRDLTKDLVADAETTTTSVAQNAASATRFLGFKIEVMLLVGRLSLLEVVLRFVRHCGLNS